MFGKVIALLFLYISFVFAGPVSVYGKLKACTIDGKGRICGSNGNWNGTAVQVRGVSLGWSNSGWESANFFNTTTVDAMVDGWKAEVIRVPLGYSESGGYQSQPTNNMNRIKAAIDAAIAKDVYVIIDWHSHYAESETSAATSFFNEMAITYGNRDHVIFEIYNEPLAISWNTIRTYANTVIGKIRENSSNLILVGTPNWAQNVNAPVGNWLSDGNVAYVLHFYSGSHALTGYTSSGGGNTSTTFQNAVNAVLNAGKPVFVSEYGTTNADGGQGNNYNSHDESRSNAWHTYFDNNKISSVAWNVNDKYEGSAFFGTNSSTNANANRFVQNYANFTNQNMMTASGKYIYNKLVGYAETAEWRNVSTPVSFNSAIEGNKIFAVNNGVSLDISQAATLQVFDLRGNLVRKINLNSGSHFVSLDMLPKNLYIVTVITNNKRQIINVPIR